MISKLVGSFLFFISFYRISLFYSSLYLSLIIGLLVILLLLSNKNSRDEFVTAIGSKIFFIFLSIFLWVLSIDVYTGTLFVSVNAAFSIRLLSLLLLSIFPAFFINKYIIKGCEKKMLSIIFISFSIQTLFWLLSFNFPSVKIFLYNLMGASNSVNLREHNMGARGFGLSNEINYTTPFMMAYISIVYFKNALIKILFTVTQLFNSNMVMVAILMAFIRSNMSFLMKIVTALFSAVIMITVLINFIPRLSDELSSGGLRTIKILLENHFYFVGNQSYEFLLGASRYLFHGQDTLHSDIGWVVLLNLGGVVLLMLFSLFILFLGNRVADSLFHIIIWVGIAFVLNFKGVLLGPNSFMFMSFLFVFFNFYKKINNN